MKTAEAIKLLKPYTIWVLAPKIESEDPNIQYYYDFTQSIKEYTKVFEELKAEWKWQPVTMNDFKEVIRGITASSIGKTPLVLNLCLSSGSVCTTFFTDTPMLPPDTAGLIIRGVPTLLVIPLTDPGLSVITRQPAVATPALSKAFFIGILEVVMV